MTIEIEAGASQAQYSTNGGRCPSQLHKLLRECSALNRARLSAHRNYEARSLIDNDTNGEARRASRCLAACIGSSPSLRRAGVPHRKRRTRDTCISAGQLTFHSPAPFAMPFWRTALWNSTTGFPIQGGVRFTSGMKETSSTLFGSCACHTCATYSRRPANLAGCSSARAKSSA